MRGRLLGIGSTKITIVRVSYRQVGTGVAKRSASQEGAARGTGGMRAWLWLSPGDLARSTW